MGFTRKDAFPSQYMGKEDITGPTVLTINDAYQEEVSSDGGKELKLIIKWREPDQKPLIMNNTNWMVCEDAYGLNTDMWLGKQVEVYIDPSVMFGGKRVGGLRLRVPSGTTSFDAVPTAPAGWTLDEAIAKCAEVNITREQLVAQLKTGGFNGWNPATCTPFVKAMIDSSVPF